MKRIENIENPWDPYLLEKKAVKEVVSNEQIEVDVSIPSDKGKDRWIPQYYVI